MVKTNWSEEAISPVISIVLIIAVVVILAAVVGTVALGTIGGTQGNSKSVAITANKGTSGIVFTVQGGADLPSVRALDLVSGSSITNCTGSAPKIGSSCTGGTDSSGRTVMVATFADGSKQVVFDKNWGGSQVGGTDYGTATLTSLGGNNYRLNLVPGADVNKIVSWTNAFTDGSGPHSFTYNEPFPVYEEVIDLTGVTSFTIVVNIQGGSSVTILSWSAV